MLVMDEAAIPSRVSGVAPCALPGRQWDAGCI